MHKRHAKQPLALALLAVLAQLAPAKAQLARTVVPTVAELAASGFEEQILTHDGLKRRFLVLPPADPAKATSTVVLLHGGTQSMRKLFGDNAGATKEWLAVARSNNVLLLVPNGTNPESGDPGGDNQFWNDLRSGPGVRTSSADDVGFILAMLDWAKSHYAGAQSRNYVTGASNGGMMTYRLLIDAAPRFTAAAAFIAALPADTGSIRKPARPVPLLIAQGTNDPLVKWEGGEILGKRGAVTSAARNLAWWLAANNAGPDPSETTLLPDTDPRDGCRIERRTFPAQTGGAPVAFYTMRGGGHAMPSQKHAIRDTFIARRLIGTVCRDVETADLVWNFFQSHGRPR